MPSLKDHQSNEYTKCLLIGDSKAGKTGALASLVKAGYSLRILDYDNGLDVLKQFVLRDCPERLGDIEFRTLRDKRRATAEGTVVDGAPKAFIDGIKMLDRWKYKDGDKEIDYGASESYGVGFGDAGSAKRTRSAGEPRRNSGQSLHELHARLSHV